LLGKRGLGSGVLSETIDRIPTIQALMPIMKETKADGKESSVKHRTDPANSQIKVKLGITLFHYNRFTRTNFMRDCKES
jgi:hypothetical protein